MPWTMRIMRKLYHFYHSAQIILKSNRSHHLSFYAVYVCQNHLILSMHATVTSKRAKWWPTRFIQPCARVLHTRSGVKFYGPSSTKPMQTSLLLLLWLLSKASNRKRSQLRAVKFVYSWLLYSLIVNCTRSSTVAGTARFHILLNAG